MSKNRGPLKWLVSIPYQRIHFERRRLDQPVCLRPVLLVMHSEYGDHRDVRGACELKAAESAPAALGFWFAGSAMKVSFADIYFLLQNASSPKIEQIAHQMNSFGGR